MLSDKLTKEYNAGEYPLTRIYMSSLYDWIQELKKLEEIIQQSDAEKQELIDALIEILQDYSCKKFFSKCVDGKCPLNFENWNCKYRNAVQLIEKHKGKTWEQINA